MKATIKPITMYEVTIDGKSYGAFSLTRQNESMSEMKKDNRTLVVNGSKFDLHECLYECDVIKASKV